MKITPPLKQDYPEYYHTYIQKVMGDDLIFVLKNNLQTTVDFISTIPIDKLEYRYQEGKWTIKEILIHLIDAERIFAYRALRFARKDKTPLPGFEENDYVPVSNANIRNIQNILHEFTTVRNATISLFENLSDEQLNESGTANNKSITVRSIGYTIAGHEQHHVGVIKDRYLHQ